MMQDKMEDERDDTWQRSKLSAGIRKDFFIKASSAALRKEEPRFISWFYFV